MKKFQYNFNGNMVVQAQNKVEAEKIIESQTLKNFLLDEQLFEIDEFRVAIDLDKRKDQIGTTYHPATDSLYQQYILRKHKYSQLFENFIQCKISRKELLEKFDEVEKTEIDSTQLFDEFQVITVDPYEITKFRFFHVGEKP